MIRSILLLGNEVLRKKSLPVEDLHSRELEDLIEDLFDTLHEAKRRFGYGHGIAAPQIGVLKRVVLIDMLGFKSALINPRILWASEKKFEVWDSCFSFGLAFFVLVDRCCSVKVEYNDAEGKKQVLETKDTLAELLQHEIDHLDGILATDKMKDKKKLMMRTEWEKKIKPLLSG